MRYSQLFGKTIRQDPKDEVSVNAKLLTRGGFIRKEVAGVYNFLPLGLKVLNKITNIVRDEMNKAGGQEILLSALQNKASWEKTDRWNNFDALFKVKSRQETEYALGPTHEEVVVPLVGQFISSYKDLPLYLYQIQNKFRDEARAKSGILRGREFLMKDLYSFHTTEEDFEKYYERMKEAYSAVFTRCGLDAILTEASGGAFSKFSHEYQVITEAGEDEIIYCAGGDFSQNTEIAEVAAGKECDLGHGPLKKVKTIEVGNIFPLKTKFSDAFGLTFKDKDGSQKSVIMGCYGIGISRLLGTIVEVHNDDKGIIWPKSVAPYDVNLIELKSQMANGKTTSQNLKLSGELVYEKLREVGIEVLWDDREDVSAGEKFADCDLIGIPVRLVVSAKTGDQVEWKNRGEEKTELISIEEAIKRLI
ncbi:proline--tRNA ligase [Candidatus Microgenomates bacterium]|nr:proline--tRNA ligase [Candidatus Microgenomates bacterium]